jgi:UDP-2,3-diacylglucosamine hydrolase
MATFFISDVHLGLGKKEKEKEKEDLLLGFLETILPATDTLFIVGDLFDFWFEYDTVIPKGYHRTLSTLQKFTERGIRVHYLVGNHDFWMGDYFATELGMELHFEPFEIQIDGKRIYLHHGDGLAQNDLGYKLMKPVLRSKASVWLFRWLHPDLGVRLAKGLSQTSRDHTSKKVFDEEEGMERCAGEKIRQGVDIVIMGHQHKPNLQEIENGMYVNLGDWITFYSYGELVKGAMALKTWNPKRKGGDGA